MWESQALSTENQIPSPILVYLVADRVLSNQFTDMKLVVYFVSRAVIFTVIPVIPGDYWLLKLGIRFLVNCGLSYY
jgi:hypothetical protein